VKIFLDTSILSEIETAISWGVLDGVTTNPSLLKAAVEYMKSKGETIELEEYISKICKACENRPVSLEVISTTAEEMIKEGKILYEKFNQNGNVVIKIPVEPSINGKPSADGLKAIKVLSSQGIPINTTLIFTPEQALLAAKSGASYVSPFAGRIDDLLREGEEFDKKAYYPQEGKGKDDNGIVSGVDLIEKIVDIFSIHKINTEVLAASLRNARQVREAALTGADIATLPLYVLEDMLNHEKTKEGIVKFSEDVVPEYKNIFGDNNE
jgi:transaldolase